MSWLWVKSYEACSIFRTFQNFGDWTDKTSPNIPGSTLTWSTLAASLMFKFWPIPCFLEINLRKTIILKFMTISKIIKNFWPWKLQTIEWFSHRHPSTMASLEMKNHFEIFLKIYHLSIPSCPIHRPARKNLTSRYKKKIIWVPKKTKGRVQ